MELHTSDQSPALRSVRNLLRWVCFLLVLIAAAICILTYQSQKYFESQGVYPYEEPIRDLWGAGRYEEMLSLAQQRIRQRPDDAYAHYHAGVACYRLGRYKEAVEHLEKAEDIYPAWQREWTGPMIDRAKEKLREAGETTHANDS